MLQMQIATTNEQHSFEELNRAIAVLVRDGTPAISELAAWALEHPQEMAFHSVRGLSKQSGANVNTVYRLAVALGFSGFEECRAAFQAAIRARGGLYGARAAKLTTGTDNDLHNSLHQTARENLDNLFDAENVGRIQNVCAELLRANKVYCVGVRSGYSLAHYLAYTGHMAFENFARPITEPGAIADALTETGEGDCVVLFTFSLYSAEVVQAHRAAVSSGASIIAVTDAYTSPIAREADFVFCLPMAGPQTLPTQAAGFTLIDVLIATMISHSEDAPDRIASFEQRLVEIGSYLPPDGEA